jgi:hypothetical protein
MTLETTLARATIFVATMLFMAILPICAAEIDEIDALVVVEYPTNENAGDAKVITHTNIDLRKSWVDFMRRCPDGTGVDVTPTPYARWIVIVAIGRNRTEKHQVIGGSLLSVTGGSVSVSDGSSKFLNQLLPEKSLKLSNEWRALLERLTKKSDNP